MYLLQFLLVFVSLQHVLCQNEEGESLLKKVPGFLFTIPRTLTAGKNESVCLTLHEKNVTNLKIIVDLKIKDKHHITTRTINADHTCFDLAIPSLTFKEPHYVNLQVQLKINNVVETFHNQDPILIYPSKSFTFIQTDRAVYKPGDKIKIRVLVLNNDLSSVKKQKIASIKIKNPMGITVSLWDKVNTELGLVQLEYQLTHETVEGKWTIETNNEEKQFEVRKHILPRFKITVEHPKIIYTGTEHATFRICAKYFYDQEVKGSAVIKISDTVYNMQPITRIQKMHNGCSDFTFTNEDLYLHQLKDDSFAEASAFMSYDFPVKMKHLHIVAAVSESGTNHVEFTTSKSIFSFDMFDMKFTSGSSIFQPGLPYFGTVKLENVHKDTLEGEVIEVCYTMAVKRSWNVQHTRPCSNFTVTGSNYEVPFSILPFKPNVIQFYLYARSVNRTNVRTAYKAVYRLHSSNGNYIYLKSNEGSSGECKGFQHFTVYYTVNQLNENENITFYYMIKSRGTIHKLRRLIRQPQKNKTVTFEDLTNLVGGKHKFTKMGTTIDTFELKYKLEENIISDYLLLVYYVLRNGDVVAATKDVNIKPCLQNMVETRWSENQYYPGDSATMHIRTSPNSLCSVSAVDKSTKYLSANEEFTINTLFKQFLQQNEAKDTSRLTCIQHMRKTAVALSEPFVDLDADEPARKRRKKRMAHSHAEDMDTYNILAHYGIVAVTNLKIITKPCYEGPVILDNVPTGDHVQFYMRPYSPQSDERTLPLRNFFPETWLWELIPVNKNGEAFITRKLPHTITNWVSSTMCVSPTHGVGLSEIKETTAFQPFFVDILTPYSIRRGEMMHLRVKVFNYLNYSLPIRVSLVEVTGLEKLGNTPQQQNVTKCVAANEHLDHVYLIRGRHMGKMNVTVLAEIDSSYPSECGPEYVVNKRDAVSKMVLVEPEGYPIEVTKSSLICVNDTIGPQNITYTLEFPQHLAVPNTEKAKVILNADLLGSTIEHLEELLTIPTGCGEQIMSTLAPNLYILRYLNATHKLTTVTRQRAIRNIKIGYQRILAYRHKDGSFSAFGRHDAYGSMFLTAFAVRTLAQAKEYIYVDENVLNKAVKWIIDHQLENGCFAAMLHVFQDMGGTSKENSTAALTAYVMISLLEVDIQLPESVKTNAKYCIRAQNVPDKYTLAISCNALYLLKWETDATNYLDKLIQNVLLNKVFTDSSSEIEIMSYILLSLIHQNDDSNLAHAHQVVRWLVTKKNSHGGFKTTQDTVVALDALTRYAAKINGKVDLNVKLSAKNQEQVISIGENDRLKTKRISLVAADNVVHLTVTGEGCLLAQAVLSYNLYNFPQNQAFNLAVEVTPASTADKCTVANINPCLTYNGPDSLSNMAVLEVNLPSGYEPDRTSLYQLVDAANSKVKMFEEKDDRIILYFTKVTKDTICAPFIINEHVIVQERANSTVKLYDYYKPENEISKFYDLNLCTEVTSPMPQLQNLQTNTTSKEADVKRDVSNGMEGLNPDFVNMDVELQIPNGTEGNSVAYISPDGKRSHIKTGNQT